MKKKDTMSCMPSLFSMIDRKEIRHATRRAQRSGKLHGENLDIEGLLPLKFQRLHDAKEIWLQNNKITGWTQPNEPCWQYAELIYLNENDVFDLPSVLVAGWTKLEELNLSGNKRISRIPIESESWAYLKQIYLDRLPLMRTIPDSCGKWTHLKVLHINQSGLEELPEESVSNLVNLTSVVLSGCKLKYLPKSIGQWKKVAKFFLIGNQLCEIPDEIGEMESLEKLYLNSNQIKSIPESIGKLANLQELYLTGNPELCSIPNTIANCLSLNKLYLNDCDLEHVPDKLPDSLEILQLNGNKLLEHLPDSVAFIPMLKFLHISGTNITTIPPGFVSKGEMRVFEVGENKLRFDSKSIELLATIETKLIKPWQFSASSTIANAGPENI